VRPQIVTTAPCSASSVAVARPIPEPPPVTSADLPSIDEVLTRVRPQPSIEMACFGQRRTASSIFGRISSGGSSWRMYRKSSSRTSNTSGAIPMHTALLSQRSKSTITFMAHLHCIRMRTASTLLRTVEHDHAEEIQHRPGDEQAHKER